ncbi:hypothetical protein BDV96DRAFT_587806 [Lophiotrema nucula]|uniref:J domain-containing protein n=1 Tax=Lophiotrema nucula TaxID=690887 RepID=A0A6A5YN38_9PLEO|nr:hypothetical protein BDV96DRAFT_587806 [Lophiotrema nucula]
MGTHYETLGVVRTATTKVITTNYRDIARTSHPDKTLHLSPAERTRHETYFKKVLAAYEVLKDKDKRKEYDRTLPLAPFPPRFPRRPTAPNWSQTWAPNPNCQLAKEPEDVNPSFKDDMGYTSTRDAGPWSYTIRLSKRFDVTDVLLMPKSSLTVLQEGFPFELHLRIDLEVRDDMPGHSQDTEDVYIAIHKSPAVCNIMHTYFQNNRYGKSVLAIVVAAAGEPSTPQCRPDPWEFPFDVDMGGWVPGKELEKSHVIATYITFSNDRVGPPKLFGGTALAEAKRLKLEEDLRKATIRCGEKVFIKRAAVRFK